MYLPTSLPKLLSAGLVSATLSLSACAASTPPQTSVGTVATADNAVAGKRITAASCAKDAEFLRQMSITDGNGQGTLLSAPCPPAETAIAATTTRSSVTR